MIQFATESLGEHEAGSSHNVADLYWEGDRFESWPQTTVPEKDAKNHGIGFASILGKRNSVSSFNTG